jgi:transcriptional regulator with XRE-family HTH domain
MKRGRPKGRSSDNRSFGPLGDLIRKNRLDKGYGLSDVAKACGCSVQFISNIEHGRAPLPWDKAPALASFLKISLEELQAANLAIRSDFKSFVGVAGATGGRVLKTGKKVMNTAGTASAMAATFKDAELREIIEAYQSATATSRKRFVKAALKLLQS